MILKIPGDCFEIYIFRHRVYPSTLGYVNGLKLSATNISITDNLPRVCILLALVICVKTT